MMMKMINSMIKKNGIQIKHKKKQIIKIQRYYNSISINRRIIMKMKQMTLRIKKKKQLKNM